MIPIFVAQIICTTRADLRSYGRMGRFFMGIFLVIGRKWKRRVISYGGVINTYVVFPRALPVENKIKYKCFGK